MLVTGTLLQTQAVAQTIQHFGLALSVEDIERERQAAENGDNHNENQSARDEEEEFASAWSGGVSDDPIPGDAGGNLKLAFLMAEIVSEMKSAEGSEPETSNELRPTESISTNSTPNDPASKQLASSELVKQLNVDFSMFRNSSYEDLAENTNSLTDALEQVATVHPNLVARIADFQSRIIEHARRPIPSSEPFSQKDWEDDIPF